MATKNINQSKIKNRPASFFVINFAREKKNPPKWAEKKELMVYLINDVEAQQ